MDNQKIIDICNNYYITPKKIEILQNGEKVLAKVETAHTYYLKGESDKAYVETCCTFANLLHDQGFLVTQYMQSSKGSYTVQFDDKVFTLELGLPGKPLEVITDRARDNGIWKIIRYSASIISKNAEFIYKRNVLELFWR
ncbi:hypothetical protein UACE39S_04909 [Ureibacillus acetophenoni]